jgi:ribosome-binding protein aMBF1 (putative translation factor)
MSTEEMDDLDRFVESTVAEHPEFKEMLDGAILARQLVRRLVDAREEAGLTQTEVARRMGTTQSAIARFESGDSDPRLSTVERYAQVVGVDLTPEVRVA